MGCATRPLLLHASLAASRGAVLIDMSLILTKSRGGEFLTLSNDTVIGESIRTYGEWSYREIELIGQFIRPGSNVIEAGSNIGSHTMFIARDLCPQGAVFAFEPRRLIFQMLCANMILNGVTNVHPFQLGLGAHEENFAEAPIPLYFDANFGGFAPGCIEGKGEILRLVTLDSMLDQLPPIQLIKADVEGYEADMLRGARQLIARDRPVLYLENDRTDKSPELLRLIDGMGYRSYWHTTEMFRPDNFAGQPADIFGAATGSFNILSIPRDSGWNIIGEPEITDFDNDHPLKTGA